MSDANALPADAVREHLRVASPTSLTPAPAELCRETRVMRFQPAITTQPQRLSSPQIAAWNRDGYLPDLTIYGEDEAVANRAAFDQLLARFHAAGKDSYAINSYHVSCRSIYDIATEPRLIAIVRDLLGEDVVCWGTHYFCKMPGDPRVVAWHQDAAYWPLSPSHTLTVWLAIDDADPDNASMRVIPGSHLHGLIPSRPSRDAENNVLWTSIDHTERFGTPVSMRLRAGHASIHSDLLLHGSEANLSTRRRCGLTLRYCPVSVRSYEGWNAQSIIVSGSDPSGHWNHLPRPPGDDPFAQVRVMGTN